MKKLLKDSLYDLLSLLLCALYVILAAIPVACLFGFVLLVTEIIGGYEDFLLWMLLGDIAAGLASGYVFCLFNRWINSDEKKNKKA